MSHEIFSRPSNTFGQAFKDRFPRITTSQWREILAAGVGLSTAGAVNKSLQTKNCDDMFKAEAIILDLELCRMRLADFGVPATQNLFDEIRERLQDFWTSQGRPCPPMFWSLREYLVSIRFTEARVRLPRGMFSFRDKAPFDTLFWLARPDIDSVSELPPGPFRLTEGAPYGEYAYINIPVTMRIVDHGPEDLPAECQHQFPLDGYPAAFSLDVSGPRGVSFGDFLQPEELSEDEEELSENEDYWPDDDEGDVDPDARCEYHPERPAFASTDSGDLCEDCFQHYVDGYIRD